MGIGILRAAAVSTSNQRLPDPCNLTRSTATRRLTPLIVVFATLVALGSAAPAASAYTWGWGARSDGPTATTYDWGTESCNTTDLLEEPVRAFRYLNSNSQPRVQGNFADDFRNRRVIGTDLGSMKRESTLADDVTGSDPTNPRDCGADGIYIAHLDEPAGPYPGSYPPPDDGPATYRNREFLTSPYIKDGKVYALVHNEFHGESFTTGQYTTGQWCPSSDPGYGGQHCWYSAVTLAVSDGDDPPLNPPPAPAAASPLDKLGSWYEDQSDYVVATIPYRYEVNWGRQGYGSLTNIIKGERQENGQDAYYFLVDVSAPSPSQKKGICLLRTTNLTAASSWRAWDGDSFDGTVNVNPYSSSPPPSQAGHLCEPVSEGLYGFGSGDPGDAPRMAVRNLTYNRELDKYTLVGTIDAENTISGQKGQYYSYSDDLINWSTPQLLIEEQADNPETGCQDGSLAYPSLLDPTDPAASATPGVGVNTNFDHPDRKTDLYMKQGQVEPTCSTQPADVVHTPIELKQRRATLEGSSLTNQPSGYDATQGPFVYHISAPPGSDYDPDSSDKYAQALTWGGQATYGYGRLGQTNAGTGGMPLDLQNGDDVWYGTAFRFPSTFLAENSTPQLMRWETATGHYGGIRLNASDKLELIRSPGQTQVINAEFTLPIDRWFWLEVHQKLNTSSSGARLNEVYIDGKLVGTSTDTNRGDSAPIKRVNYGFVFNYLPSGVISSMSIDRSSILGAQRGAVIGSGSFQAARTPIGVRSSAPGSGQIKLDWNGPAAGDPSVDGYRIYERQANGTWDPVNVDQTSSPTLTKSGLAPCSTHAYRIAAYRSFSATPPNPGTTESLPSAPVTAVAGGC